MKSIINQAKFYRWSNGSHSSRHNTLVKRVSPITALITLVGLIISFTALAYAAITVRGTLYATGITAPSGQVWLGNHFWVSDHVQGFCRLDSIGNGMYAINPQTCISTLQLVSPGQPVYDPSTNYVYIPDNSAKSQGVWRFTFYPNLDPNLDGVGQGKVKDAFLLASNKGLGGNRPTGLALNPADQKLYVSFLKNGNIVRITNLTGDDQTQNVEAVGSTSDSKRALALTFVGNDLYLAEKAKVSIIRDPRPCTGGCKPSSAGLSATSPTTLIYDGVDYLYVADNSVLNRYSLSGNNSDSIPYASIGMDANNNPIAIQNISGLGFGNGVLSIGDDPSAGAQVFQGRIWTVTP